ncbi:MAG: dethiobiotin synthase [Pseudonocardiales bacterium]|nr:dethiobiotin synthase [Pseudonocardiales bacterium]
MTVLVVTGTGTDVGKTVATAALAACATGSVAVVKPVQTGVAPGEPGDLAEVTRLSGVADVHEFRRYPDPLSPHHAAIVSGLPELDQGEAVMRIADLDNQHDLVIVEGAGGLLVPFDKKGWTIYDLGLELGANFVLVTSPGLGTINHTALTVGALHESATIPDILIGSWPAQPDLAMRCNIVDLGWMAPKSALAGVLPAGMATMRDFRQQARAALAPKFGGNFDWLAFRAAARP